MKKNIKLMGLLALGLCLASCSDDDEPSAKDFYTENAEAWGEYAVQASSYLEEDANTLYNEWYRTYASDFKNYKVKGYNSSAKCAKLMLESCATLINAMDNSPVESMESKFAQTSAKDYQSNILSVASTFLGNRNINPLSSTPMANQNSLYTKFVSSSDKIVGILAEQVLEELVQAYSLLDEPTIDDAAWKKVCADLYRDLNRMQTNIDEGSISQDDCDAAVQQFVDNVVLPSYKDLKDNCIKLSNASSSLKNPTSASFVNLASAWEKAHRQWELTEAFAFGPAKDNKSADKMDTNPISESSVKSLIKSKDWNKLKNSNNIRGFHAMEYLIYEDGAPRKVK